jgi:hypothetical protein
MEGERIDEFLSWLNDSSNLEVRSLLEGRGYSVESVATDLDPDDIPALFSDELKGDMVAVWC